MRDADRPRGDRRPHPPGVGSARPRLLARRGSRRACSPRSTAARPAASRPRPCTSSCAPTSSAGSQATIGSSIFPAVQNLLLAATAVGLGSALTTLTTAFAGELTALLALARPRRAGRGRAARLAGPTARAAAAGAVRRAHAPRALRQRVVADAPRLETERLVCAAGTSTPTSTVRGDVRRSRGDALHRRRLHRSPRPQCADAAAWRSKTRGASAGFGLFATELTETGELIGFAGLAIPDFLPEIMPSVEIGWRLVTCALGQRVRDRSRAVPCSTSGSTRVGLESRRERARGRQRSVGQRHAQDRHALRPRDDASHQRTRRAGVRDRAARYRLTGTDLRRRPRPTRGSRRAPACTRGRRRTSGPAPAAVRVRPSTPGSQRLAQPGVRAELEVRVAVTRDRRSRRAPPGARDRPGPRAARRPGAIRQPHAVGGDLERAVGAGDDRQPDDVRGSTRPRSAGRTTSAPAAHRHPHREGVLGARRGGRRSEASRSTVATSPSQVRTWSTMCEPDAPSQPPPRAGVEPPLGHARVRDRRRAGRTARASPGAARRSARRRWRGPSSARSGDQRNSWPTSAVTPAPLGRRDHRLGLVRVERERLLADHVAPARRTLRSRAARARTGGAAIVTASTPGQRERVRRATWSRTAPRAARLDAAVRSGSRPTSATTSNPAARSAGTCTRAPNPVPTTAAPGTLAVIALVALVGVDDLSQAARRARSDRGCRRRCRAPPSGARACTTRRAPTTAPSGASRASGPRAAARAPRCRASPSRPGRRRARPAARPGRRAHRARC